MLVQLPGSCEARRAAIVARGCMLVQFPGSDDAVWQLYWSQIALYKVVIKVCVCVCVCVCECEQLVIRLRHDGCCKTLRSLVRVRAGAEVACFCLCVDCVGVYLSYNHPTVL